MTNKTQNDENQINEELSQEQLEQVDGGRLDKASPLFLQPQSIESNVTAEGFEKM